MLNSVFTQLPKEKFMPTFSMHPHPSNLTLPIEIVNWIDWQSSKHSVPKGLVIMSLIHSFLPDLVTLAFEHGYDPKFFMRGTRTPSFKKFLSTAPCPAFNTREGLEAWLKLMVDEYADKYFASPDVTLIPYPPQVIDLESFEKYYPEPHPDEELEPKMLAPLRIPQHLRKLLSYYQYENDALDVHVNLSNLVMYAAFWADPNKLQNMHPHHVFSCIDIMRYDHPLRALPLTVYDLEDV